MVQLTLIRNIPVYYIDGWVVSLICIEIYVYIYDFFSTFTTNDFL